MELFENNPWLPDNGLPLLWLQGRKRYTFAMVARQHICLPSMQVKVCFCHGFNTKYTFAMVARQGFPFFFHCCKTRYAVAMVSGQSILFLLLQDNVCFCFGFKTKIYLCHIFSFPLLEDQLCVCHACFCHGCKESFTFLEGI